MPLQQFGDYEARRKSLELEQRELELECVKCPRCSSQWFEQLKLARYKSDHFLVLGQDVPLRPGTVQYVILKCAVCNNMLEPRVQHNPRDIATGDYKHLRDTMAGKYDTRTEEQKEVPTDAIPTERF